MNRAALRRLARLILPGRGRHRRQPSHSAKPDAADNREVPEADEQWILDLLPPTPRAPEPMEADWPPRIARWVRAAFPQPDDTIIMGIRQWAC